MKTIGYTNGYYDLFHIGHLRLIQNAAGLCDHLIVGVITDDVSEQTKGKRPIVPLDQRLEIVRGIKGVGVAVAVSDDNKRKEWIKYHFSRLFVGSDHQGEKVWDEYEESMGKLCDIIYLPHTELVSTSKLIEEIQR